MWRCVLGLAAVVGTVAAAMPCEEANMKCAYRTGCGMALRNYLMGCSSVLQEPHPLRCPEICQHALIALTSTDEGKELMQCQCSDDFCEEQKQRVEICRPQVQDATRNESVVSCAIAQLICGADPLCSTAMSYYNQLCRSMFHGKKCTNRCRNSINILSRQEKAAKLNTCKCDGQEDYDCPQIQTNMARLCFHKKNAEVAPAPPPVVHPEDADTRNALGGEGARRPGQRDPEGDGGGASSIMLGGALGSKLTLVVTSVAAALVPLLLPRMLIVRVT